MVYKNFLGQFISPNGYKVKSVYKSAKWKAKSWFKIKSVFDLAPVLIIIDHVMFPNCAILWPHFCLNNKKTKHYVMFFKLRNSKARRSRYVSPQWNADRFAYALRRYLSLFPARAIMFHFFPIFFVKDNGAPCVL